MTMVKNVEIPKCSAKLLSVAAMQSPLLLGTNRWTGLTRTRTSVGDVTQTMSAAMRMYTMTTAR